MPCIFTIIVVFARFAIAEAFFGHGATGAGTIALTATLLVVGATYFITDGIQTIVAGALRGLNDTRVPLLLAVVSYWLIGFTMACVLGFRTELGAVGVWIGLSCGTLVYAILLILRFRKLASRFGCMTVEEVTPQIDPASLLAGAQFMDAYRLDVDGANLDARRAAERMMARAPRWVDALLVLRNIIVAPFGLKGSGAQERLPRDIIGIFPVVSETPERLVAGFNDKHLDFRVVLDVATSGTRQSVTATTLVLTHNWLGRTYLATIMPFHRIVVRAMLAQVAGLARPAGSELPEGMLTPLRGGPTKFAANDNTRGNAMAHETETLAGYVANLKFEDIPPEVLERAKVLTLDFLGSAIRARRDAESTPSLMKMLEALKLDGKGESTVFGDSKTWTPAVAALLNGALGHSLDFDDTHANSSLHPSAPVVPAAFAVGEMTGASGRDVLTAIVAGYEVCCRLGNALDPTSHYARGFHPTATAGTYGAAAAAGKLFGLVEGADHLRLRRLRQPGGRLAAIPRQRRLEQALPSGRCRDERRDRGNACAQ